MSKINNLVCKYIEEKRLTINEASKEFGLSFGTMKRIIYNKAEQDQNLTIEILKKIAKTLGCTVNQLIDFEEEKSKNSENEVLDQEIFKISTNIIIPYLNENNIILPREKVLKLIDDLSSLLILKKQKGQEYKKIDDDAMWFLVNSSK